ncbi:MAG TPA: NADP-dependent oxidoreductase [Mycobacteriales bacterium]|nr:NADP-dependent oxidoreductase [Mycobacteriales bacterium]
MSRAVRFDRYGDVDVLHVTDVEDPQAGPGQVQVTVRAAGVNPGEVPIREGAYEQQWPSTFPSGQGSDFAGVVSALGPDVTAPSVGTEVIGWSDERGGQAELVVVPAAQVVPKPPEVPWEVAGGLYVAGGTAVGVVDAVAPHQGETVVVSGAAGGVGVMAVQLARRDGADVIGIASAANADWLSAHGVRPVPYGDGLAERLHEAAPGGLDAWIDLYGGGYLDLAASLGVPPERTATIIDFGAAEKTGAQVVYGSNTPGAAALTLLAGLIAGGELDVPVAAAYPLDQVRAAYTELAKRHTRGKIVLVP